MTKSVELHKKDGTYREDRHGKTANEMGLKFVDSTIEPPRHLTESGQRKWLAVLQDCQRVYGYIAHLDLGLLERYCMLHGEWSDLLEDYNKAKREGSKIMDLPKEWKNLMDMHDRMMVVEKEMGFTPISRGKVKLPEQPKKEKKEDDFKLT